MQDFWQYGLAPGLKLLLVILATGFAWTYIKRLPARIGALICGVLALIYLIFS